MNKITKIGSDQERGELRDLIRSYEYQRPKSKISCAEAILANTEEILKQNDISGHSGDFVTAFISLVGHYQGIHDWTAIRALSSRLIQAMAGTRAEQVSLVKLYKRTFPYSKASSSSPQKAQAKRDKSQANTSEIERLMKSTNIG